MGQHCQCVSLGQWFVDPCVILVIINVSDILLEACLWNYCSMRCSVRARHVKSYIPRLFNNLYYFTASRDGKKEWRKEADSKQNAMRSCCCSVSTQRRPMLYLFHASCQAKLATPVCSLLEPPHYKELLTNCN